MKTDKNPKYFYDTTDFPHLKFLESETETLNKELHQLASNPINTPWLETFPDYTSGIAPKAWEVFTFRFFGMNHSENIRLSPKTYEIISSIPSLISCDFSKMKGQTEILPHKGYSKMALRCHLPLLVPEGNTCGIMVGDEVRFHEEGKLIIFDDSFTHSAWNRSLSERIVLMFDIPNPLWGYTSEEISSYKVKHLDDPFLLNIATKERWLEAYEQKILPL